ncbi:response regulator [Puniceibacterium sediminis]|uniref:Response regulator receiver domain-containing protein n=1 Tax=Puniceibacterium sediminis TaxID=1608407 RepID=A0A238WYJ8_9RHOB|nr:response regulator [Puniceibacterium sediminis]SNR51636.1 Response regulator receiver domain-containing protein [Puniceibacterium sediminis]
MLATNTAPQTSNSFRPAFTRLRVLILDDSELDRLRLIRMCDRAGIAVETVEASDLKTFSDALDQSAFDLVFVDYLLAEETGLQAVEVLRSRIDPASCAVIMLVGVGRIQTAVEAIRKGCSDYLLKEELTTATLRHSVDAAIEQLCSQREASKESTLDAALERTVGQNLNKFSRSMRSLLSTTLLRTARARESTMPKQDNIDQIEDDCFKILKVLSDFHADTVSLLERSARRRLPKGPGV